MNELDAEKITAQLGRLLSILETNLELLNADMNKRKKSAGVDPLHIEQAVTLTRSAESLSKEARAWYKTTRDVGSKLTRSEQVDLMVAFVGKLPSADRTDLFDRLGVVDRG